SKRAIEDRLPSIPDDLFEDQETLFSEWVSGPLLEADDTVYYCDPDNYEILLRFQRAALRPEVIARPAGSLPGAIAHWQGFGKSTSTDHIIDALQRLRGYSAPVKVWLGDLLASRFQSLSPSSFDEALIEAELGWQGTGRETITIGYPEDIALLAEAREFGSVPGLFADPAARYSFVQLADRQSEPLDVFSERFWEAVWQGELTADTLAPLNQGLVRGFKLPSVGSAQPSERRPFRARRRGFSLSSRGYGGNWQLSVAAEEADDPLVVLEDDKERARLLLDRYGFLCRELANREGGKLRWAKLFRALCMMELSGEIVSGYFYTGFSGPQFMTPAALQSFGRDREAAPFWINALDPASPCGLGLVDPDLPQRRPQNYLSYAADELALVIENLGRKLTFHLPPDHPGVIEVLQPLCHLVKRHGRVVVDTINDNPARSSPYLEAIGQILKGVKDHKQIYFESR
ncbi:MAG: hypothetical protein ACC642_04470, partial [Pseudomonadales bacterium]